jgi:nucleotide-binding universal stress UspA family protein
MPQVIVSYDGTRNDRDALLLGRVFAQAGGEISLAYVRHATEPDPQREAAAQREAEHLLSTGAGLLEDTDVGQHVIVNSSTAEGLAALGSSYRTPPGRVDLPQTAEQLLDRGIACSLALAPAGLRRESVERSIGTVSVYDEDEDQAAQATAKSLAHALGAVVTEHEADLLVITSRPEAHPGQLLLSASGREQVERAPCPVLVLARGAALSFG